MDRSRSSQDDSEGPTGRNPTAQAEGLGNPTRESQSPNGAGSSGITMFAASGLRRCAGENPACGLGMADPSSQAPTGRDRILEVPQSLANVLIHIVFSTKLRAPMLSKEIRQELHSYMVGIARNNGCSPVQIGGVEDHVHLLISLSRTITIAQLVEHLKTGSSKWLKEKGPALKDFAWQAGYGVFSVSPAQANEAIRYVQSQEAHHQKLTFQEEFRSLMAEAGVEIDERYVWD